MKQSKQPPSARKRPKQSRSLMLVKAIQEACLQILENEGPDKLTTQRIADVAGVNIASVYQYFPNKEAVLAEVYEEELAKIADRNRARFREIDQLSRQSLEQTLVTIIDWEVEQILQLHELNPDFYREYQHSFDAHRRVNELTQALQNPSWEDWFIEFLGYHKESLRSSDTKTLAFVARHTLQGNLQAGITENPGMIASETFKKELLANLLNYLLK